MAEVVVTRADREAALRALHDGLEWLAAGWVMTGRDGSDELGRAAIAIAKARAEGFAAGREAERRDVVVHLETMFLERAPTNFGNAKVLCLAASQINNELHVGASEKARGE